MRRLLLALSLSALPLMAQSVLVSVIRQPRATAAEFTVPITDFQVRDRGDLTHLHLGVGLGLRHWDDGDNALRFVVDANATAHRTFIGLGAIVEVPPGEGGFIGPRLRIGWAFHPAWALSLEGEHLERPFTDGLSPRRRSNLGLALTTRF
ncbi:hypothetical protein [Geothrix sp.]|jgi:hypothetical protein|uniref:hypothetical protein n=1 Tax=Geothrix sp. TaxID=1962974 RepID=UPI0025BD60CB|nr:hypothetical protein [Geothrix sp.]